MAADGNDLPNPRDVACRLISDQYEIEPLITHIFMQWGQFLNHELTSLSITRGKASLDTGQALRWSSLI